LKVRHGALASPFYRRDAEFAEEKRGKSRP